VTIIPWRDGQRLVWEVTSADSFAISYRTLALRGEGRVAETAEIRKLKQYLGLETDYIVQPVASETLGAFRPSTGKFIGIFTW
jgi:hypothetical protein